MASATAGRAAAGREAGSAVPAGGARRRGAGGRPDRRRADRRGALSRRRAGRFVVDRRDEYEGTPDPARAAPRPPGARIVRGAETSGAALAPGRSCRRCRSRPGAGIRWPCSGWCWPRRWRIGDRASWITVLTCVIGAYSAVKHSRYRTRAPAALVVAAVPGRRRVPADGSRAARLVESRGRPAGRRGAGRDSSATGGGGSRPAGTGSRGCSRRRRRRCAGPSRRNVPGSPPSCTMS